jgi:hypothetical protein
MAPSKGVLRLHILATLLAIGAVSAQSSCSGGETRLHIPEPPYDNYFFSNCDSDNHVVVTSPLSTSNLDVITPRLLIAWPAGNSGIGAWFTPENGQKGSLHLELQNSSSGGNTLEPIYDTNSNGNPRVGVSGFLKFDSAGVLSVPILGSIRTIRNYAEGGSLDANVQNANVYDTADNGVAHIYRTWFGKFIDISEFVRVHEPVNSAPKAHW